MCYITNSKVHFGMQADDINPNDDKYPPLYGTMNNVSACIIKVYRKETTVHGLRPKCVRGYNLKRGRERCKVEVVVYKI